jgi:nucleoside-diphosphate-sugar epimerase
MHVLVWIAVDIGISCVIHTASPIHGLAASIYHKVNVDGTLNVIEACQKQRVSKLIYTSSAGVIYNGSDLFNANESIPYCEVSAKIILSKRFLWTLTMKLKQLQKKPF